MARYTQDNNRHGFSFLFPFLFLCAAQNRIYRRTPLLRIVLPRARLAAHLSMLAIHSTR